VDGAWRVAGSGGGMQRQQQVIFQEQRKFPGVGAFSLQTIFQASGCWELARSQP
jgi:hypothetical protein